MPQPDEAHPGAPIPPLPRAAGGFQPVQRAVIPVGPPTILQGPAIPPPGYHSSVPPIAPSAMGAGLPPTGPVPPLVPDHDDGHSLRRHLIEDTIPVEHVQRPAVAADASTLRPANQRRSSNTLKVFCLTMFIMVDCFAASAWFLNKYYRENIEPRLAAATAAAKPRPSVGDDKLAAFETRAYTQIAKLQSQIDEMRATALHAPPSTDLSGPSPQISIADGQLSRVQSQVNALRAQQAEAEAQLKKLAAPPPKTEDPKTTAQLTSAMEMINHLQSKVDSLTTQLTETNGKVQHLADTPPPAPPPAAKTPASANQIGSIVSVTSDAGHELRLLKERNRLTLFADQALANASSKAMASMWEAIRDPDLAFVRDGTVAEIVRVQHFYSSMPGLPPNFHLPIDKLFKGTDVHAEEQLKDDQIIKLMHDQKQPPEVRTRAAMILSGHPTKAVGDALIDAMIHDPNLLVVRAAQNSLQDNFQIYAPRLFDTISMQEAWAKWKLSHPDKKPEKAAAAPAKK